MRITSMQNYILESDEMFELEENLKLLEQLERIIKELGESL